MRDARGVWYLPGTGRQGESEKDRESTAFVNIFPLQALFAYHIEALVPTPTQAAHPSQAMPQKISGTKDVHFFSVGVLQGRTLIVYMKKKGVGFGSVVHWLLLKCIRIIHRWTASFVYWNLWATRSTNV